MKWIDALKMIGPVVLATIPQTQPYAPLILKGIEVADDLAAPGAKKKEAALDIIRLGAQIANTATKSNAINADHAVLVASGAIDLVVRAANELHDKSDL